MITQGAFAGGFEGDNVDQGAPPPAPDIPVDQVTNEKIRFGFELLTQVGIETTKFYGSNMEEDL